MPPVGFKPTISVGERPQTYAFDRAAIGTGTQTLLRFAIAYTEAAKRSPMYVGITEPEAPPFCPLLYSPPTSSSLSQAIQS